MFYVLNCQVCDEESGMELDMPFESPADRGRWAAEHKAGTGHDRWLVRDVPK